MIYGESAETLIGKTTGGSNYLCPFRIPHQAGRLLHPMCLAGAHYTCYSCNRRRDSLPDLEKEARLQLVKQEGVHV